MNSFYTPLLVNETDETTWVTCSNKNITALMYYLILHANHKKGAWMGVEIKRGEWVFSQRRLIQALGMSVGTLNYTLKALVKMGLVKLETHSGKNGYSKISILNYDDYVLKAEKAEEEQEYPRYQRGMELEEGQIYQF